MARVANVSASSCDASLEPFCRNPREEAPVSPDDSRLDAWDSAPGLVMLVLAIVGVAGILIVALVQGAGALVRTAVS